jgi:hypothetical protein
MDADAAGRGEYALQKTITLQSPKGIPVLSPVLESADGLVLGAFSKVNPTNPVVAMGTTGTRVEPDAKLNDLWSRGATQLKDRVHVYGSVHSPTVTPGNGVIIDGVTDKTPVFDPTEKLTWSVTYPTTPTSNVDLVVFPPKTQSAAPGNYDFIRVGNGSVLTLSTGTYYTNTFQLESGSQLLLDQDNGPVLIYVATNIALRGAITQLSGASPDIFIGYLGTNAMFVESSFDGVIVSPFAGLTLRNRTPIHRGFFAGKSVELDAQATVGYRFPLPLIPVVKLDPTQCRNLVPLRSDLTGAAQEAAYVKDLQRYCGLCVGGRDTDKDGAVDCVDECPYDALKKKRGACDCGNPETDADNDKIPACIDRCDKDSNNVFAGDCGCVGSPGGVAQTGTPCFDRACPNQPSATCNGAGVCGNRATCKPAGDCYPVVAQGNAYWVCGGNVPGGTAPVRKPWQTASQACAAKGMVLARVDTYDRNQLIRGLLQSFGFGPAWLGGNSRAVASAWRWAKAGSDSGDQFWTGGATGARVGGRFTAWSLGRPASQRCLALQPSDGRWLDNDCNASLAYVCEVPPTPHTSIPPKPPIAAQPTPSATCIAANAGPAPLPDDLVTLRQQYEAVPSGSYTGAAASPPAPGNTCLTVPPGVENCPLTDPHDDNCTDDAQCVALHGAGYYCRATKLDPNCVPVTTPGAEVPCATKLQCGKPSCPPDEFANRCNQVEVCADPNSTFTFNGPDSSSNLTPQPVDTTSFFPPTKPDQTPSATYSDPANGAGTGRDHAWCKLNPQATTKVQPAQTDVSKHGASGEGSPIKFTFDPDLQFDANPGAAAFGEAALKVHALASLTTHVSLKNFLKQNYEADILKVAIGLTAERCRVSTSETTIKILNKDFTSLAGFIPRLDTDDIMLGGAAKAAGDACKSSFSDFLLKAGRLKKAFRDAQQLLLFYQGIKEGNLRFPPDFCQQIGIDAFSSPDFPLGGFCPEGETPEETINRFIDYYQGEAFGQLFGMDPSALSLSSATQTLKTKVAEALGLGGGGGSLLDVPFVDFKRSESTNILSAQFLIGPVPMTIEIDAVASYGVHGGFNLDLNLPTQLSGGRGDLSNPDAPMPQSIAKVGAGVEPWASAGLSLFVGAGFSVPGVSASVGIEGAVTLARVGMPVGASAGLALATTPDTRPLPTEVTSVAAQSGQNPVLPFGDRNAYQFFLQYQYGASVTLSDVLSGVVNGRLRIKFFFFSRTWRKKIVEFKGWGPLTFPLISGGGQSRPLDIPNGSSITLASGLVGMGRSESPLPFVLLNRLIRPQSGALPDQSQGGTAGSSGTGGTAGSGGTPGAIVNVDKSQVEKFSYDDLCCSKQGQACPPTAEYACCPGLVCNAGVCDPKPPVACSNSGQACGWDSTLNVNVQCCSGAQCPNSGICPTACSAVTQPCGSGQPACCPSLSCVSGSCQNPCVGESQACGPGTPCCPGFMCTSGVCERREPT